MSCDVILLCETWLQKHTAPKNYTIPGYKEFNNYRKHLHKKARRASGGMIVYIKHELLQYVQVVESVCDHFMVLEIKDLMGEPTYVIFSYIIPKDTTYLCKTCDGNYFDTLTDLVINYSNKGNVSICGDLNSRTANMSDEPVELHVNLLNGPVSDLVPPKWSGSNALPPRVSKDTSHNANGLDLLALCHSSGLRIINGRCFQDKGIGEFTYSINGNKSVIDYLLLSEKLYCKLSGFDVGIKWPDSDHAPIYFEFNTTTDIPKGLCNNKAEVPRDMYSKFVYYKDSKPALCESLFDETGLLYLKEFTDSIADLCPSEQVAQFFNNYIHQACSRSLKHKKGVKSKPKFPVKKWFDKDCKEAKSKYTAVCKGLYKSKHGVNSRAKRARKYHKAHRKTPHDEQAAFLEKKFKCIVRNKKRKYFKNNIAEIQGCKNQTQLWSILNHLKPQEVVNNNLQMSDFFQHFSKPPVDNTDNKLDFDLGFESEMKSFLQEFSGTKDPPESNSDPNNVLISEILNSVVQVDEVTLALDKLSSGKSPGIDGIPIDVFISLKDELSPILTHLFNYIFENGSYPDSWSVGLINPVPKVPMPQVPEKFRRISVLPAVSKIFETIMNNRLEYIDVVFEFGDLFNGGFKKGCRTSDNLFVLNGLVEKYRTLGIPLYVCFVDFKRAFDCINRVLLFAKLCKDGLSSKVVDILLDMYTKTSSKIKWKGFLSEIFKDSFGVNQGGITSPYLFKRFLKGLTDELKDCYGVTVGGNILKHLLWADDLFLVSTSPTDLQHQINQLHSFCKKWQLVVNTMKTKVMLFGIKDNKQPAFHINNEPIETCSSYVYVGNHVSGTGNIFSALPEAILQKCYRSCYKIRDYCENLGQLLPSMAVHLYNTLLVPIMEYGSEVWYNRSAVLKLERFERKFFRRNLHVRQQTPNLAVYGEYGIYPLEVRLQGNVIKFLHRLENMPLSSPVKWVYDDLRSLHNCGLRTWVTKALEIFREIEGPMSLSFEKFLALDNRKMKITVKKTLLDKYRSYWFDNITNEDLNPKLRSYNTFKTDFCFEPYLNLANPKLRTAIARFRVSSHHLAIETGRHTKPKVPVQDRLCDTCVTIDDELHHLVECEKYSSLRDALFTEAAKYIKNFDKMQPSVKFIELLQSKVIKLQSKIGNFLVQASSN